MQSTLPLAAVGRPHVLRAHGVQIDFEEGRIRPPHFASVGNLIGRILRYGTMRSLRWERCCSVLFHSALVGRIASELARGGHLPRKVKGGALLPLHLDLLGLGGPREWSDSSVQRLLGLYGAMHDIGEIFGGDHTIQVPEAVKAPLMKYQGECRDRVMLDLGLPLPSLPIQRVIKIADRLAVPAEKMICPDPSPVEPGWVEGFNAELREAGVVGVDAASFGRMVMGDLEVDTKFPTHLRSLSMWKATVRADIVLLSRNHYVAACAGRDELPARKRSGDRLGPILEWMKDFGGEVCDTFHDLGSLRQSGVVESWPIRGRIAESAA